MHWEEVKQDEKERGKLKEGKEKKREEKPGDDAEREEANKDGLECLQRRIDER